MKTKLKIEGMNCVSCVAHIEKSLEAVPGVKEASVTLGEGATVEHETQTNKNWFARLRRRAITKRRW